MIKLVKNQFKQILKFKGKFYQVVIRSTLLYGVLANQKYLCSKDKTFENENILMDV